MGYRAFLASDLGGQWRGIDRVFAIPTAQRAEMNVKQTCRAPFGCEGKGCRGMVVVVVDKRWE